MRSAASFGTALPEYWLHVFCVSSCVRRSSFAWPCSLNDARSTAAALALMSSSLGPVAQPRTVASTAAAAVAPAATIRAMGRRCIRRPSSALDGGRIEHGAVRVTREEHRERNRRVGSEDELGESLL